MDTNSKRIAKNTLYLYLRMLVMMFVSLYTARIVLDNLGVIDYGIYNVIGGITVFLGFFSSSLTNATQRFLTVALGHKDVKEGNEVFNQHLWIYLIICLLLSIIGEIVGPWFIIHKMTIPAERLEAALIVFHVSIFVLCVTLIGIVFNSALIAHEDMKVYSYISILEALLKLFIAYSLTIVKSDLLVVYAILMAVGVLIIQGCYMAYCLKNYPECRFRWYWDKKMLKRTFNFVGWNTVGTAEAAINEQGIDVLINIFFGPIVNAARGITGQVSGAVYRFSTNFLISVQPQIVKSYVNNEHAYLNSIFFHSSKYSYYLLWIFVCPLLFCIDSVLNLWLVEIPQWTSIFIRWSLCTSLLTILAKPIWFIIIATGNLKKFTLYKTAAAILIFPITYVILLFGASPDSVYVCFFVASIGITSLQIFLLRYYIEYSFRTYLLKVIYPVFKVTFLSYIGGFLIYLIVVKLLNINSLCSSVITVPLVLLIIWFVGMSNNEHNIVLKFIKSKIRK